MKDGIKQIIGKRVQGILISDENTTSPPTQVFLLFDDGTYYELWGSIRTSGGIDSGSIDEVKRYVKQFGGKVTIY